MRIPNSTAIMSMLAALCMVTPASPDPEQRSALAEAPEVMAVECGIRIPSARLISWNYFATVCATVRA